MRNGCPGRILVVVLIMAVGTSLGWTQGATSLTVYKPAGMLTGKIRIWGDPSMSSVVERWEKNFQKYQPKVKFENRLLGSDMAIPGIYTGNADLALLGRESNTTENDGFFHTLQYRPIQLRLMTGSLDVPGKSYALTIFVHRGNPISRLTLTQLDAIFGCKRRRGQEHYVIRKWGQLGLSGTWKNQPIHLYTFDAETGTGLFFVSTVMQGSWKMNWKEIKEFKDIREPDGTVSEGGRQIADALRKDPYGLAVSSVGYGNADIRPVSLALNPQSLYYGATRQNLLSRRYPLMRTTYAFLNRVPGRPVDPALKDFLRYVYSYRGQQDVLADGGFLPLPEGDVQKELKKLEQAEY